MAKVRSSRRKSLLLLPGVGVAYLFSLCFLGLTFPQRLFTDAYVTEENALGDDIVFSASHLIREATQKNLLDDQTELVLNVTSSGVGRQTCHYYFVNHVNRRLFWLTDVRIGKLFRKTFKGVTQPNQLGGS